ncbi:hypothetical protein [Chryseobacterium sp. ISL-6]|uniref:hypothetical protein n=1 Tax=Chryseobacterium sp. ISL-6 TaxID=2819143 RepID=UPI001BE8A63C|nr:hypothetical protein [Chryseobacterium sp. ISL-6]MBT2623192.1 hypothetical protein [Chryseobacterium sp. ISL-6]
MGNFMLYIPLAFTAFILFMNYRKKKSKDEKISLLTVVFQGVVVYALSALFFGLVAMCSSTIGSLLFKTKYEARVVEHEASSSEDTYRAVVEFKDSNNLLIKKPLNYGGSDPVEIGKMITIGYENGDKTVTNLSFGTQKLVVGAVLLFFFVLGLAVSAIFLHAVGKDYSIVLRIALGFVVYIVFPLAMLFFIGVMSWVIWEYFQGKRDDMPIWALGICSLFVTILIPAFFGYMKMLFSKDKSVIKLNRRSEIKRRISK